MHRLTDFKNFANAELDLFKPLTVLIGRNGSGKTNLIEGIELLAALARGVPFNEITDIDRGGTFEVRGGLRSGIRFGGEALRLDFDKAFIRFDGKRRPSTIPSRSPVMAEMTSCCPRSDCKSESESSSTQPMSAVSSWR